MSFINSAWLALARVDEEFINLGRMPVRDAFWDDDVPEHVEYSVTALWLVGWWIPVIVSFLIVGYLINWNWMGLW